MLTDLTNIRSTKVLQQVEDDLWCKTNSKHGRRLRFGNIDCSHKYKINQGVTEGGRQPSVEDDLWWKTTLSGR